MKGTVMPTKLTSKDSQSSVLPPEIYAAGKLIAVELGMRFLNDIVTADYFTWNETRYQSRRDNHFAKATEQSEI
jgi:hypothetical protein